MLANSCAAGDYHGMRGCRTHSLGFIGRNVAIVRTNVGRIIRNLIEALTV